MNKEDLVKLKNDLDMLARGIDPQSKLFVGDDSILSSKYNQNILNQVSIIIDKLIDDCSKKTNLRSKYNFYLTDEEKEKIKISDVPISISAFSYAINELVNTEKMKKISAMMITSWLVEKGYLEEIQYDNKNNCKISTSKGEIIGIKYTEAISKDGKRYNVNLYNSNAQQFIIKHLDEIS